MPHRLHVIVRGRVQGVGYRYATYRKAQAEGVSGWVRNLRDGAVEAEFEGDRETLAMILEWCGVGPPLSRVTEVTPTWSEGEQEYSGFEIRG